jgi:hypothetical protein
MPMTGNNSFRRAVAIASAIFLSFVVALVVHRAQEMSAQWVQVARVGPVNFNWLKNDLGTAEGSLVRIGMGNRGVLYIDAPSEREQESCMLIRAFSRGKSYLIKEVFN